MCVCVCVLYVSLRARIHVCYSMNNIHITGFDVQLHVGMHVLFGFGVRNYPGRHDGECSMDFRSGRGNVPLHIAGQYGPGIESTGKMD